jgi:hypothetical protein
LGLRRRRRRRGSLRYLISVVPIARSQDQNNAHQDEAYETERQENNEWDRKPPIG